MLDRKEIAGIFFVASLYAISRSLPAGIILLAAACVAIKANDIRIKIKDWWA